MDFLFCRGMRYNNLTGRFQYFGIYDFLRFYRGVANYDDSFRCPVASKYVWKRFFYLIWQNNPAPLGRG